MRSVVSPALLAQLASGDLGAAMVEEPWVSRLLEAGRASVLVDLRQPALVGDRARFEARVGPRQGAYAGTGEATLAGLETSLRALRAGGSPWPVTLSVGADNLASPPGVAEARRQLGPAPPAP
jgi:hypothetical protein